jgi:hypothetical protein
MAPVARLGRRATGAAPELSFRAKGVHLVPDGNGRRRAGRVLRDGRAPRAAEAGADVGPAGASP